MEQGLIPNTNSWIQLYGELARGLQGQHTKFGILSVSAIILVFHLPFSFCNLVFAFSFYKFVLCFGVII